MPAKGKSNNPKGRPPGIEDKRTLGAKELAKSMGCDPLEVLIHFTMGNAKALGYEDAVIPPEMRLQAAKEACRYIHPTLKAVEHSGGIKGGFLGKIIEEINGSVESEDEG